MDGFDLSRQGIAQLTQVSDEIVAQLEQHTTGYALTLAENRLTQLHGLQVFQHVVRLDVSDNRLMTLEGIQALRCLENLSAARNSLTSIDALHVLRGLKRLDVSENNLDSLDAIASLPSLVSIDASYNNLSRWPDLGKLVNLEALDLSSNLLSSPAPHVIPRLFPANLRRFAAANNQMREICGIGTLGLHAHELSHFDVDGNPIVAQLVRSGGSLSPLLCNVFLQVRDPKIVASDHVLPNNARAELESALVRGDEQAVLLFLRHTVPRGPPTLTTVAIASPYPAPEAFKVEELSHPDVTNMSKELPGDANGRVFDAANKSNGTLPVSSAAAATLSKENKMAMWKQLLERRKAEQAKPTVTTAHDELSVQPLQPHAGMPPPIPVASIVRTSVDRESPPSYLPAPANSMTAAESKATALPTLPAPTVTTTLAKDVQPLDESNSTQELAAQVQWLNEQTLAMRKYVKVWVKREKVVRQSAVRHIAKWFRRCQLRRAILRRVQHRRLEWYKMYSIDKCGVSISTQSTSKGDAVNAISQATRLLQRIARGWLVRYRVKRWRAVNRAALVLQRRWRAFCSWRDEIVQRFSPANSYKASTWAERVAVTRLALELHQTRRVCFAQTKAIEQMWEEMAQLKRFYAIYANRAARVIQASWRRRKLIRSREGDMPQHLLDSETRALTLVTLSRTVQDQARTIQDLQEQLEDVCALMRQLLPQPNESSI